MKKGIEHTRNGDLIARVRARATRKGKIHDMARGMSPAPSWYERATPEQIAAAEAALGFGLPPLYRQLLTEVANGGFGPGYGLIGVDGGSGDFGSGHLAELYARAHAAARSELFPPLPGQMLPVCNWGCGIYSCLDCRTAEAPVYFFNPDLHVLDGDHVEATLLDAKGEVVWTYEPEGAEPAPEPEDEEPAGPPRLFLHKPSLAAWMEAWAKGTSLWNEMERLMAEG